LERTILERISSLKAALNALHAANESMNQENPCRHEHVRIFQRKLRGLERRLAVTRAWLPVGFKLGDFGHLSEGSFCFCANCRARLYPRRTQAERLANRLAALQAHSAELAQAGEILPEKTEAVVLESSVKPGETMQDSGSGEQTVHVEELEPESVDVQDIEAEGVILAVEDSPANLNDEDV
jgi:hypothetical protein